MNRSLTTIVGFGVVAAIFLAILSVFYLQQIPSKEDMQRLESDLRREHGLFFAATAPISIELLMPKDGGDGAMGVAIDCTLRPDLRKRGETIDLFMQRIAESALAHPDWRGKVSFARVRHAADPKRERTVRADETPEERAPVRRADLGAPPAKG
ncbi:MAG: hypothetical protein AAGD14_08700 [Planctomycetota bacterium]